MKVLISSALSSGSSLETEFRMSRDINGNYIYCFFLPFFRNSPEDNELIDIFYSEACDIEHLYNELSRYISAGEQSRADRFRFEADRKVYVLCHALLRLVLSRRLSMSPREIVFSAGSNNKPFLPGNPLYFNLSHTREAFAFAISGSSYVGIDIENLNRDIDFDSIADTCFNISEREFINEPGSKSRERFLLLWTRKEAFLKAIGTGIAFDLKKFGTSCKSNLLNIMNFEDLVADHVSREHFIYSANFRDHCLSVASPRKASIKLKYIDRMNVESFLLKDYNCCK